MKLDYGTQLSPAPIKLSIGSVKKPLLRDIADLSFDKFYLYQVFLKLTPEQYFTKLKDDEGKRYWQSLSEEKRESITLYSMILENVDLQKQFSEIFNFFFLEYVVFKEDCFILLKKPIEDEADLVIENVSGIIAGTNFVQVIEILQQVCSIYDKEQPIEEMKFKNNAARKIMEKILKGKKKEKERKKADINLSLPNIISSVSNMHPTINPVNVWDMTLFQLFDAFNRLQVNTVYSINSTRVSVWGDEKKTFDVSLWYKNSYDEK